MLSVASKHGRLVGGLYAVARINKFGKHSFSCSCAMRGGGALPEILLPTTTTTANAMPNPSPKLDHMPPPNPAAIEAECAPKNRVTPYAASVRALLLDAAKNHLTQAPAQQPAPDFGEPWQNELGDFEIYPRTGGDAIAYAEGARTRDRVIACVNACAGMANPAAEIQALRDAVNAGRAFIDCHAADPDITPEMVEKYAAYQAALAKLKAIA